MARELELKFKLPQKQIFIEHLRFLNIKISNPIEQNDTIFLKNGQNFSDIKNGAPVLRIREESNRITVTLKKYITGVDDREEIEFGISEVISFKMFLSALGFSPMVKVKKTRMIGIYNNITITIDHVEELGDFTELEIISNGINKDEDFKKIKHTAKVLGLEEKYLVSIPYDEMLFEKENSND